jgi:hypothetical protein
MLQSEGIQLLESRVNLKRHFWFPVATGNPRVKRKAPRMRNAKGSR